MKLELLVAFDTPSDRRRRKITRVLSRYGRRVQRSVFKLRASAAETQALWEALRRICLPEEDLLLVTEIRAGSWRAFGLPAEDAGPEITVV